MVELDPQLASTALRNYSGGSETRALAPWCQCSPSSQSHSLEPVRREVAIASLTAAEVSNSCSRGKGKYHLVFPRLYRSDQEGVVQGIP